MRPTGSCGSRCRSSDGRLLVVEAKRLIKAYGFGVMPNDPLEISSKRVQSVSPDFCDMRGDDMRASDTPVWIIGGGKTAMDTAHALITEYPGREVNLVAGSGTFFTSRDRFFPTGVRRWWDGTPFSSLGAGTGPSFRRHQRDGRLGLVPRQLRHLVDPRDRELPGWACCPKRRTRRSPQASTTWSWTTSWMPSTATARPSWCSAAEPPRRSNRAAG